MTLPKILKNRLFWSTIVVLGIIVAIFFNPETIRLRRELDREIRDLRQQRDYYRQRIAEDSLVIWRLQNDDAFLEQYARENYLMKRDSDEIFIIVRESSDSLTVR